MADTVITRTSLEHDVSYKQSQIPTSSSGTFVGDDTDYHSLTVDGRGKGRFSYTIQNKTNKTATITLYGSHSATGLVDGGGVVAIAGTSLTVAATSIEYDVCNDPFDFYIIRVKFAATPDGEDVIVYIKFSAF